MPARTAISVYLWGSSDATHSASARGMPVNAMHEERNLAPARMNMIMQDRRVAPIRLSQNVCRLSPPDHQEMASAPSTPYAAASVAVAQPITITQTMNTMSARHGTRCRALYSFSLRVVLISSGGVFSGFMSAQMTMYPENSAVSTKPGMKPARNTLMIDTSAATAYTTMMIDGGSRMPSVPAAASEPRQVFSS